MEASIRRTALASLIALGGGAFLIGATASPAQAQSSCITQCRDAGWGYSQCNRYCASRYGEPLYGGRRAYRYAPMSSYAPGPTYRYRPAPVYRYGPVRSGDCGEFKYLKNGVCVDARTNPPNIR